MHAPNDYALLIGVEDYSVYDHSMDLPAGTSAVAGARHDARTFFRQCLSMGFSAERIRVLTSPRLSPRELGPEATEANVGDATHAGMIAGLGWIVEAVSGPRPAAGLLTFSGHGVKGGRLLLCPSDTTGSLEQAIDVSAVSRRIGGGAGARRLTVLLDCCHAEVGDPGAGGLAARLLQRRTGEGVPESGVAERVIAACRQGQASAASLFGGERMGAFTWAITSAMGQWQVVEEHGVARLGVPYGELTALSHALLGALAFKQVPVLTGPPGVALLPFLHPGPARHEGEVAPKPSATREHRQLDGGWYTLRATDRDVELAQIFATADYDITINEARTAANTEYWYVSEDALKGLDQRSLLQITYRALEPGQECRAPTYASTQTLTLAEDVSWVTDGRPLAAPPGTESFTFGGNESGSAPTICLQLLRTDATSTLSGIGWYNNQAARNVQPSGSYPQAALPRTSYYAATWSA